MLSQRLSGAELVAQALEAMMARLGKVRGQWADWPALHGTALGSPESGAEWQYVVKDRLGVCVARGLIIDAGAGGVRRRGRPVEEAQGPGRLHLQVTTLRMTDHPWPAGTSHRLGLTHSGGTLSGLVQDVAVAGRVLARAARG